MRENLGLIGLTTVLVVLLGAASFHKDALRSKINEALAKGQDFSFETDVAGHLGIDKSLAAKVLKVPASETTDGRSRDFNLVLHEGRPFRVVLWSTRRTAKSETSEAFAAQTDGRLRRAIMERSTYDASGHLVPGTIADLRIHSSSVQERYQRELDFWLEGKYRKAGAR